MNRLVKKIIAQGSWSVFTVTQLASLQLGSSNARTALVKRAIASGDIIQIRRGLYCLAPLYQKKTINPLALAQVIYGPSYISLESALSYHGWIPEAVYSIVSITNREKRNFTTPLGHYVYESVPQKILYTGTRRIQDAHGQSFMISTPLKALCDYVYHHRLDWACSKPLCQSLRIEQDNLALLTKEDFAEISDNYRSRRVQHFLKGLAKDLKL